MTNTINTVNGTIETRGLFQDPIINGQQIVGDVISSNNNLNISGNVSFGFVDKIMSIFDYFFYFLYMLIKIPMDILGWIFGFGTGSGTSGFFASLLSGDGLLGYLGYFLSGAPFSKLFGSGIGKEGGYKLFGEGVNPVLNFFSNPFDGPSFMRLFFGGTSGYWWLGVFALAGVLFFARKKISILEKKASEIYDNPEESVVDELFHDEEKKKRWSYILDLLSSDKKEHLNESILLADELMTDVFLDHGFDGGLKHIFSKTNMKTAKEAITSRTIAEAIKEEKVDSVTKIEAKNIIDDYSRVFRELYYM